jgi:hypothetical protein
MLLVTNSVYSEIKFKGTQRWSKLKVDKLSKILLDLNIIIKLMSSGWDTQILLSQIAYNLPTYILLLMSYLDAENLKSNKISLVCGRMC